jgi:hypothetical protein
MRTFLIISICLLSKLCISQKNITFVEFGGIGGVFSRNFERQITSKLDLSIRIGVGFSFFEPEHVTCVSDSPYCNLFSIADYDLAMPFSIQYLINLGGTNYIETGLWYTLQFQSSQYDEHVTNVYFTSLGFRKFFGQAKGWMWKVNFTPVIAMADPGKKEFRFNPWGGIAIGKRF